VGASRSGSITDASHFLAIILVGLDGIQPDPEEDGCVNRCSTRGFKHVLIGIVVQLDPLCCKPVLSIELLMQGAVIELGDHDGFVYNF
jgi:hypothetical protein